MKYLLIILVVPILIVALILEKILGYRYEGFLTGKTCGWHKVALVLLLCATGAFSQTIRREGDCVFVTFLDLPPCSRIEYSMDLSTGWFPYKTFIDHGLIRTPFVELQIKATSGKAFWRLMDCAMQ